MDVPDHAVRGRKGHVFQLLTKRPERAVEWWRRFGPEDLLNEDGEPEWPAGIWMGTSIEEQRYAGRRLAALAKIPAPVRFVSAEPLLGPLNLRKWLGEVVQWVIVGGESGLRARPGESGLRARPMEESWALRLLEQCDNADVPAFLKQLGGRASKRGGDQAVINGRTWRGMPAFPEMGRKDSLSSRRAEAMMLNCTGPSDRNPRSRGPQRPKAPFYSLPTTLKRPPDRKRPGNRISRARPRPGRRANQVMTANRYGR